MRRRKIPFAAGIACAALLGAIGSAAAQTSASYSLQEAVLNAGGHPAQGASLASASYAIRLHAIGEPVQASGLASASFRLGSGFAGQYPPPGEVTGLKLTYQDGLSWDPEPSAGAYNVYRDYVTSLPGPWGNCIETGIAGTATSDISLPVPGRAFFYLVTAENILGEEGTKGFWGGGLPRANPLPCP